VRRAACGHRRRRVRARPPAQRRDASVLQERNQRDRHRCDHRGSRHRQDHALQAVRLQDQSRQRGAGERRQAVARMVHRRHRRRRRRRAGQADAHLPGAEDLVCGRALLRLPLHQCGRRARQGPEAVPQHRAEAQEDRARPHREARRRTRLGGTG
ncbi:hypothetical protein KXV85_006005, partial [Aspergillus fumigatus]